MSYSYKRKGGNGTTGSGVQEIDIEKELRKELQACSGGHQASCKCGYKVQLNKKHTIQDAFLLDKLLNNGHCPKCSDKTSKEFWKNLEISRDIWRLGLREFIINDDITITCKEIH